MTFEIPPGSTKKLHLKLCARNFNSSIQLLASFSGMKVRLERSAYSPKR